MLVNAHSFKERSHRLAEVSAGLFTYPVLMAADILLYQAEEVPVGKDQAQHLEMTRDIASSFNHCYGSVFRLPEIVLPSSAAQRIPGTDGEKMSKSYGNTVDVFLPPQQLRAQIMRIPTDSRPLEAPKDPEQCLIFQIYSCVASEADREALRALYLGGDYGYGAAKQTLYNCIVERFDTERSKYETLMQQPHHIEEALLRGEARARATADETLNKVREVLGFA